MMSCRWREQICLVHSWVGSSISQGIFRSLWGKLDLSGSAPHSFGSSGSFSPGGSAESSSGGLLGGLDLGGRCPRSTRSTFQHHG